MNADRSDFKVTNVIDWESEPKQELASGFAQSTGYSSLSGYSSVSGYYSLPDAKSLSSRSREHKRGLTQLLMAVAAVVGLGAAALYGLVHLLRG